MAGVGLCQAGTFIRVGRSPLMTAVINMADIPLLVAKLYDDTLDL